MGKYDCDKLDFSSRDIPYSEKVKCFSTNYQEIDLSEIYTLESEVFDKSNAFNKLYACYVRSEYNRLPYANRLPGYYANADILRDCTKPTSAELEMAYRELSNKISQLQSKIEMLPQNTNTASTNAIYDDHRKILAMRNELDDKIGNLQEKRGSEMDKSKLELDSTVYASLLWTTLATCLIYYTFTAV